MMSKTFPPLDPEQPHYMMEHFQYEHLQQSDLRWTSKQFFLLADMMDKWLDHTPEKTVMLRKILEAKDCAVRACLADINKAAQKADEQKD